MATEVVGIPLFYAFFSGKWRPKLLAFSPASRRHRICAGFASDLHRICAGFAPDLRRICWHLFGLVQRENHHGFWKIVSSRWKKKKPEDSTYTSIGSFPQISSLSPFVSALYQPLWAPPIWVMLPDTAEKILFLFASSVYLCPSLATLLNYCMWERGNGLIK